MDKDKKKRIDHWIDTQKYGTTEEIRSLQSPMEYCITDDKPYIIKRVVEENDAIRANERRRWAEERKAIENKYAQKKEVHHQ